MVADDQDYHENQSSDKYVENFCWAFKTGVQVSAPPPKKSYQSDMTFLSIIKLMLFLVNKIICNYTCKFYKNMIHFIYQILR